MRISATIFKPSPPPFPANLTRRILIPKAAVQVHITAASLSDRNAKKAHLKARRKDRITLPILDDDDDDGGGIGVFLNQPSGFEAILNTKALRSFRSIQSDTYRCSLPTLQLFNFEVAPVLDLRVTPTAEDCTVELLSCKFEGSEIVQRQNNYFSASMTNHITWDTNETQSYVDIDVNMSITLEIFTQPFALLPISAVEGPGNLMMQALVDRMVPLLLEQLLQDYNKWLRQKKQLKPSSP